MCRAASYLTCLLSGFIDGDETGHGDRAAGVAMARGDEFLAVMASLADQIGAGGVRVHKDRKAVGTVQSIAAVEVAAIQTGGCGACNGLGSTSTWS